MKILWTLPYYPWPTSTGGKTRQYYLLRELAARGHRITLLVLAKVMPQPDDVAALDCFLDRLIVIPRRPLRSLRTVAGALFSTRPMLATVNGLCPIYQKHFENLLKEPWDIIQVEHSYGFEPLEATLRRSCQPFLLTEHNVESDLSKAVLGRLPPWLYYSFFRWDCIRYRRWEQRVLNQARCLITVTVEDAQRLATFVKSPIEVVVNGVDSDAFAKARPDLKSQRVLFLGNFDYFPNVDALHWTLKEIMPQVWQTIPTARFAVYGHQVPVSLRRDYPDQRIEWGGFVANLADLHSQAAVFIAPLRHGGGSKLKVLEAMAAGLPIVATGEALSGLRLEGIEACVRGDNAKTLADGIVYCLTNPMQAEHLGEIARTWVKSQHDWKSVAAKLDAVYKDYCS